MKRLAIGCAVLLLVPVLSAGPPPHAEASKKKSIKSTVNSQESGDYGFFDLSYVDVIELSQPFEDGLALESEGESSCEPARTGTILHAPAQFDSESRVMEKLPSERFMGILVIIDVTEAVEKNPAYVIESSVIDEWELENERIPKFSWVIFRTGWSDKWEEREEYLSEAEGKPAYPTLDENAARLLAKGRKVYGIGIDTACPDGGTGAVHNTLKSEEEVLLLENLTNLEYLPTLGAWLVAFPPRGEDSMATPTRVIAFVRPDERRRPFVDD